VKKNVPASTQTHAAVEATARRTLGFAVVRAGLRKRVPLLLEKSVRAARGARRASARTSAQATASTGAGSPSAGTAARATASTGTRGPVQGLWWHCGMGHCKHGRQKGQCKDCGTGYWWSLKKCLNLAGISLGLQAASGNETRPVLQRLSVRVQRRCPGRLWRPRLACAAIAAVRPCRFSMYISVPADTQNGQCATTVGLSLTHFSGCRSSSGAQGGTARQ
jgi:hypothetical protein